MLKLTIRMYVALFFFTVAVHAVASAPVQGADEGQLLLFMPEIQSNLPDGLSYTVHKPYSELKPAISPTKPWETWAVFGYNSVVTYGPGEFRMYYDCIEGGGAPPGRRLGSKLESGTGAVFRRICLATSSDGLSWAKPDLNVYNRNGSTANNILLEDSGVSVFLDGNPKEPGSKSRASAGRTSTAKATPRTPSPAASKAPGPPRRQSGRTITSTICLATTGIW